MLRSVYVSVGQDLAGIGGRLALMSQRADAGLEIRSVYREKTYLDYPSDVLWTESTDPLVRELVDAADVLHVIETPKTYERLRTRKPSLLHHHGTNFRRQNPMLRRRARRWNMLQVVSTIDLLRYDPSLVWLPAPMDIAQMALIRQQKRRKPDGTLRIVQTPTDRTIKSTDKLEQAVQSLRAYGLNIELVMGERMTWRESLALKATADIFFDQVQLGYGCSAIEAWGMHLPVIAGGDAWTEKRMSEEFGGNLPYLHAEDTVDSIRSAIVSLAESQDMRDEYAERGYQHALRFHDAKPVLDRVRELYDQAIAQHAWRRVA